MSRRVLAIALPFSSTDLLFATLEALGLPGEAMQPHELFTTADTYYSNAEADGSLNEDAPAYRVLKAVKPGHFLPGYFFYSKAGASLLSDMDFKKIIMVRDPRDIAMYQLSAAEDTTNPWNPYLQSLPDHSSRLQACLKGFTFNRQDLPTVNKESIYKELSYYQLWTVEPDTLVVRYEDLITTGNQEGVAGSELVNLDTLAQISDWLGCPWSRAELSSIANRLVDQIFARQAQVKVGAWQTNFSDDLLPVYRKTIGSLLHKFGYTEDTRWFFPQPKNRVALISQPKAGTHLLDKALAELGLQLAFSFIPGDLERAVVSDSSLYDLFRGLQPGEYFMTHLLYNAETARILDELDYKKIIIIRDPHDVAVSLVRLVNTMQHYWTDFFQDLEDHDTQLLEAIRGALPVGLSNVSEILDGILAWLKQPDCLLVRFEDLIGTNGQGEKDRQIETLKSICLHLEIELDYRQLDQVADHVFDRTAVTFREGQIGTWKKYFKPVHHQAINKLLSDSIEHFGYKKYFDEPAAQSQQTCDYPVLAVTVPGAGVCILDLVLDELGLGRQKSFLKWSYPDNSPVPEQYKVSLDRLIWTSNSVGIFENLLEEAKPNRYLLGYFPFSEKWSEMAARNRFKKIVLVRNRPDTAVALARQTANKFPWINPFIGKYFGSLPDEESRFWAAIQGVTPDQTGDPTGFLASNKEFFDDLDKWSNDPDTLVVSYESLAGEAAGGSEAAQLAAIGSICQFLGLEIGENSQADIIKRVNRRVNPLVLEGSIGQGEQYLTRDQIEALSPAEVEKKIEPDREFTGERYTPSESGQVKYEHLHRYGLCEELVREKTILDIATGEGYGAAILSKSAHQVIGVDLDLQTVQTARQLYDNRPNLYFVAGSCTAIPLKSHSVDVVTSFETIEHHDKHLEMLAEIKRVLKPDGMLVISSPNRLVYSDAPNYSNPYHVKELYFEELDSLLKSFFKYVSFYGQRIASGSMVFSLEEIPSAIALKAFSGGASNLANKVSPLNEPVFFIAICTNTVPASADLLNLDSFYLDKDDELENHWKLHIALLQKEATEYQVNIRRYAAEFDNQQRSLEILQAGHVEHTQEIHRLVAVNTTLSAQLASLEARLEKDHEQFQGIEVNWKSERQALQTALTEARQKLNGLENSPVSRLTRFVSKKLAALRRLLRRRN